MLSSNVEDADPSLHQASECRLGWFSALQGQSRSPQARRPCCPRSDEGHVEAIKCRPIYQLRTRFIRYLIYEGRPSVPSSGEGQDIRPVVLEPMRRTRMEGFEIWGFSQARSVKLIINGTIPDCRSFGSGKGSSHGNVSIIPKSASSLQLRETMWQLRIGCQIEQLSKRSVLAEGWLALLVARCSLPLHGSLCLCRSPRFRPQTQTQLHKKLPHLETLQSSPLNGVKRGTPCKLQGR